MSALFLHDFHAGRGARLGRLNGAEVVSAHRGVEEDYRALTQSAAILDLSFRGRVCVLGADREKFLHGQVTNDILGLEPGQGCYAALINAKGKLEADLFIYKLDGELLLDFEPGLTERILRRLEKYIIAEDVQLADVASDYGLLSIQGPRAESVSLAGGLFESLPAARFAWQKRSGTGGDLYLMNNPRFGSSGFDLFVPREALLETARALNAPWAGLEAAEIARIENGIPRFGADMDETNLAPEAEIGPRAISYSKGCYIGQEVIARIRTYGQVARALRLLRLPDDLTQLPKRGDKLFKNGKEAGYITSSAFSPKHGGSVALAYARKECNALGEMLELAGEPPRAARVLAAAGF